MKRAKRQPDAWKRVRIEREGYVEVHSLPRAEPGHELSIFCECSPAAWRCHEDRSLLFEHRSEIQRLHVPKRLPGAL